jgi:2-iminobutanoate/2-iminopropanoate deaminase
MKRQTFNLYDHDRHDPMGSYTDSIRVGNTIYLGGQCGYDTKTLAPVHKTDFEAQAVKTFENIELVLNHFGTDCSALVSTVTWLVNPKDEATFKAVRQRFIRKSAVAGTGYVARLAWPDFLLEVCAVAHIDSHAASDRDAGAARPPLRQSIRLRETADPSYADAVVTGTTIYIAGQTGTDPTTGRIVEGGFDAQMHQLMKNVGAILKQAGTDYSSIVQAIAYVLRPEDYDRYTQIRSEYVRPSKLPGTCVMPRSLLGHMPTIGEPEPLIKLVVVADTAPA